MQSAYAQLLGGLALSIVLVFLVIAVNVQSWLDPLVVVMALPAALAGVTCPDRNDTVRSGSDPRHHVHGPGHREHCARGRLRPRAAGRAWRCQ